MRKPIIDYEPVFGGIVFALTSALLSLVLLAPSESHSSHTGNFYLMFMCGSGMSWGVAQIVGYKNARGKGIQQTPILGTALGCVLIGLIMVAVTSGFYLFAPNHPSYTLVSGGVTVLLLSVGAFVGIRQGIWR